MNLLIRYMKDDDKKILYVLEIKHKIWLKKFVRFESREIHDLNQLNK